MKTLSINIRFNNMKKLKDILDEVDNFVKMGKNVVVNDRFDYILEDSESPRITRPRFEVINNKMCAVYQSKMNSDV